MYRFGGQRIVDGRDLYSTGIFGSRRILLFTYTPFAAVCFVPLTLLPPIWVQTLSLASVPALLGDAVRRGLAALHIRAASRMWPLAALLIGLCLWLEPVRYSAQWGQINVLLLAVVIADVVGSPERKWAGVGVGLVAGIKLTPLIFLIYLALIGRLRAALLGSAAFAATVAVGFVVTPKDSQFYWLQRYFADPAPIAPDPAVSSSSLRGLFLRLHYPAGIATAAAVLLMAAGRAVGTLACRRGQPVLGVAIVSLTAPAASPFSWSHHWVWFAVLLAYLGYVGYVGGSRRARWSMWLLWVLLAGWTTGWNGKTPPFGLVTLRPGGPWNDVLPSAYVFVLVIVLASTTVWLWRDRAARSWMVSGAAFARIRRSGHVTE